MTPTHVIADVGDQRALCGAYDAKFRAPAMPYVWAPYVQMHVDGRGMVVCPDCAAHIAESDKS